MADMDPAPGLGSAGAPPRAVLIAGPTASGKSALAARFAERLGGVVVNADSMQVYGVLRTLTARPSPDEEARVPHRLYGHIDPGTAWSVGAWAREAAALVATEPRPLVFVGGTGLYFEALLEGLSAVPPVPPAIRVRWRERAEREGPAALHGELVRRDPAMAARLDPREPQRLARALEVLEATGRSLGHWQGKRTGAVLPPDTPRLLVTPERGWLRARIAARFEAMLADRALDEASAMAARSLDPALPAMKALGLPPLLAHLAGEAVLGDAAGAAIRDSRRYAKRQDSWGRTRMADWPRVTPEEIVARPPMELLARAGVSPLPPS